MKIKRDEILSATLDYFSDYFNLISRSDMEDHLNEVIDLRLEFLEWLGLQADEWMRVIIDPIPDPDREAARRLQTIARVTLKRNVSLEEAILNRLSYGSKLSKKILKALDKYSQRIRSAAMDQTKQANLLLRISSLKDKVAAYVAANRQPNSDIITILSANPLDILQASYRCEYNSCFRPGGEYQFAPFVILGYPTTLIAYGADKKDYDNGKIHKRWRTWVMVPSADEIQIGRYYGNPTRAELRGIRRLLEMLLDSKFAGEQRYWKYKGESDNSALTYPFDNLNFVYYDDVKVWSAEEKKHVVFGNYIGVDVEDYFATQRCDCCGHYASDIILVEGDYCVCEDCLEEYYIFCDVCEEYHRVEGSIYTEDCHWICEGCYSDGNGWQCSNCGEYYFYEDDLRTDYDDNAVCARCAANDYARCEICDALVHEDAATHVDGDNVYVCPNCVDEVDVCDKCGKQYLIRNMSEHNNSYYCDECYDEIEEEVEDEEETDVLFG